MEADTDKLEFDVDDGIDDVHGRQQRNGRSAASSTTGRSPPAAAAGTALRDVAAQQRHQQLRAIIFVIVSGSAVVTLALLIGLVAGDAQVPAHGAVVSWSSECSAQGIRQLRAGGSAVDAAIATWLCVAVTHSQSDGLGGGGFMFVRNHKTGAMDLYDFREVAPAAAVPVGWWDKPGALVGVPGNIRGLKKAHQKHGKLAWASLFDWAIQTAREGRPVSQDDITDLARRQADIARMDAAGLTGFAEFKRVFIEPIRRGLSASIVQKSLARTLEQVALAPDRFYHGPIADDIAATVANAAGGMTTGDLAGYTVKERLPLTMLINDVTVAAFPAPSSGALILSALNATVHAADGDGTIQPDTLKQLLYDSLRSCRALMGDPDTHPAVAAFEADVLNGTVVCPTTGNTTDDKGTSHISVIDDDELMVAFTGSLNYWFGSMLLTESGILLNNELLDFDNSTDAAVPNAYVPGARPLSSMTPTMLWNTHHKCGLRAALGGVNGTYIPGALTQVLHNIVLRNRHSPGQVLSQPRVCAHAYLEEHICSHSHDAFGVISLVSKQGGNVTAASEHGATGDAY